MPRKAIGTLKGKVLYMKKTRKILSIVLAVLFVFSSMPVVYVGTAAADAVAYAAGGEGTIENPTRPVYAEGSIEEEDICKLNLQSKNTKYVFYQTIDNEYFTFGQTQGLQQVYETLVLSRTLVFENISFYEGASGVNGQSGQVEISSGYGMQEIPVITKNPTAEFLSKYYHSSTWSATNNHATAANQKPQNVELEYGIGNWGGNKPYTW